MFQWVINMDIQTGFGCEFIAGPSFFDFISTIKMLSREKRLHNYWQFIFYYIQLGTHFGSHLLESRVFVDLKFQIIWASS